MALINKKENKVAPVEEKIEEIVSPEANIDAAMASIEGSEKELSEIPEELLDVPEYPEQDSFNEDDMSVIVDEEVE